MGKSSGALKAFDDREKEYRISNCFFACIFVFLNQNRTKSKWKKRSTTSSPGVNP